MIQSEWIKFKHQKELYLSLFFGLLTMISLVLIVQSKSDSSFQTKIDVQIFLLLVMITLNTLFLTRQGYLMEREANHFQNILSARHPLRLWLSKLLVLLLVQMTIFILSESMALFLVGELVRLPLTALAIATHSLISINIHLLIQVRFGDYLNLLLAIFEIILMTFATNIKIVIWYFFPSCYGYKIYTDYEAITSTHWGILLAVAIASLLANLLLVSQSKLEPIGRRRWG